MMEGSPGVPAKITGENERIHLALRLYDLFSSCFFLQIIKTASPCLLIFSGSFAVMGVVGGLTLYLCLTNQRE
jgi:hypothetical protein